MKTRVCIGCGPKPIDAFDGRFRRCRPCRKLHRRREWVFYARTSPTRREYLAKRNRSDLARRNRATREHAIQCGQPYTDDENAVLLNAELSAMQVANTLGRTYYAVLRRRACLAKDLNLPAPIRAAAIIRRKHEFPTVS